MKNVIDIFTSGNLGKTQQENVRTKNEGESYQQWGHRYAGMNGGMHAALMPALQTVVLADHQEQERDINLQQQQNRKRKEIENEQANKVEVENKVKSQNELKQKKNEEIAEIGKEIARLQNCKERRPMSQAYFIIGCFILLLLAVYLFIFYSSAAYEAFFGGEGEFEFKDLLNPHAFRLALDNSLGEFLFILLMPVIFLGLGFLVHKNLKKEHWVKYVKAGILYIITFIFDSLLAFLITKNAYTWEAASSLGDLPPYTVSLALSRPDFWVVIFAGFVAYVIWGLVFDSTMDSYEDITTNSREIREQKNK